MGRNRHSASGGGLYRLAVDRPVTVLMIIMGVVVFGLVSLTRIPLSLMPELNYPTITVRTTYEGAAPEEVENNISIPLEEALGVVSHLKRIQSVSKTDESDVLMEFDWDTDMNLATQEVSEKLERVFLPPEAKKPLILRYDPTQDPVMRLSLYGKMNLIDLRTYADQDLKRELEKVPGVAAVKVRGGLEEEIRVFLDENKISLAHLNIETLNRALAAQNINLAGGKLKEGSTEYIVRTVNEFGNLGEIADAVVGENEGVPIRVRDIGRVERSWKDRDMITRVNDQESVELEVFKEADANIVTLSKALQQRIFGLQGRAAAARDTGHGFGRGGQVVPLVQTLPEGIKLKVVADQARFISLAISNLKNAAVGGGLLAVLVLFFFLKRFRPTLLVGLAIPLSVVATFAAMYLSGVTLNIMSLGGLALGVGMLVDNAIVVLESIARCREEGDAPREAALRGVREVGMAVTASTLTTVAVFFPIVFVEGIAGQVFKDLSLTVVFALMASLVMSLFFIPMLSAREFSLGEDLPGGQKLGREIFAPRNGATALANIRGADGGFKRILHVLDAPFVLALGEPLWPLAKLPGRRRREGAGALRTVTGRALRMVFIPLWFPFRIFMALIGMMVGVLGYAIRIAVALAEVVVLWVFGSGGWLAGKALAGPLRWFEGTFNRLVAAYRKIVRLAMQRPTRVLVFTGLAFVFLFAGYGLLDTELIPQLHNRTIEVEATMPVGTPLETTDRTIREAADKILKMPEVAEVALQSGVAEDDLTTTEGGEYSTRMTVQLVSTGSLRKVENRAVGRIREILEAVPDLRSKVRFPSLFSTRTPVEVEIYANDLDRLRALNREAYSRMAAVRGITDIQSSLSQGNPEIQIAYDRERLAHYGLDIASVASLVRTKVLGQVQSKFDKGREKVDIRVQVRPEDRETLASLGDLVVNPGSRLTVPLSAVADLRTGVGPSEIRRINQQRVAVLSANLVDIGLNRVSRDIEGSLSTLPWRGDEGFRIAGQKDEMDQSSRSLLLALLLSIFLVYLVMASQFESLLHPFLIMFTIPLAFVGVFMALLLFGMPMSILVFIGMIMLAGIVVNNAIVLVDYINQLRRRGLRLEESIEQAGVVRMRPILMTTLTTLFGLMPLALGLGAGSELQSPMAITVMSGLLVSTLLTLLVIPTLYFMVERRRGGRT